MPGFCCALACFYLGGVGRHDCRGRELNAACLIGRMLVPGCGRAQLRSQPEQQAGFSRLLYPALCLVCFPAGVDNRELNLNNKLLTGEATRPVLKINDFTYRWAPLGLKFGRIMHGRGECNIATVAWPVTPRWHRRALLLAPWLDRCSSCSSRLLPLSCSKSEQINSDPNSALGSLPYTAPEVLSNTMKHGHQVGGPAGQWAVCVLRGPRCHELRCVSMAACACGCQALQVWVRSCRSSAPTHHPTELTPLVSSRPAQADVWSLGVALYKMCVGLYPFERLEDAADARTAVQVSTVLRFCTAAVTVGGGRRLCLHSQPSSLLSSPMPVSSAVASMACAVLASATPLAALNMTMTVAGSKLSEHAPRMHPHVLQNVLSRIARVEYQIPDNMSTELQDLLG